MALQALVGCESRSSSLGSDLRLRSSARCVDEDPEFLRIALGSVCIDSAPRGRSFLGVEELRHRLFGEVEARPIMAGTLLDEHAPFWRIGDMLNSRPEFLRIPPDGQTCPHTGLSRTLMRLICTPSAKNNFRPPVPGRYLRQRGKLRGTWLIPCEDLLAFLAALPTSNCEAQVRGQKPRARAAQIAR